MKNKDTQMLTTFVRPDNQIKDGRPEDFGAMINMLIVLLVLTAMAGYYYGLRALAVSAVTVAVSWLLDCVCLIIRRKRLHIHDISPIITGLTLALMLPASVPYTVAAAAAAFAVCIAKHPFGGHGHEIFNCAAVGYIFAELSYPQAVLMYPKPLTELSMSNTVPQTLTVSFTRSVNYAASSGYSDLELLIGKFPGPMGCTFTVLIIVCAAVLISRKAISSAVFITEISCVLGWSLITGGFEQVKMTAAGGMLIFGIMALSCDYSLMPKTTSERIMFGFASAVVIIAISEISYLENPVVYAAVISAPFARLTDLVGRLIDRRKRMRKLSEAAEGEIGETIAMIGENTDAGE